MFKNVNMKLLCMMWWNIKRLNIAISSFPWQNEAVILNKWNDSWMDFGKNNQKS